ncbi:thiamine ABC transporter ATP-binding protein [Yoonia sediminilitoris]|uniref:Thiamine transport system ATP-binding protein n=1 Tax=Yoonia sediminilitoris TaxID=1286148 RepID=A0A2T6KH74_9RHOB|nr:ATP-binding cassette domain-containing protein [Yoonia sediminilitoris]PUB14852.1 thiamine transport system ATP-binding protein [Yoonia sediminilitoris]RCW95569.1 thiamine transport system ATP-binding protein [Yoonia sediminilitoris]
MLKCENLFLKQGDFTLQADLNFPKGAVTALMGPSGAGKSTLLAALAGFLQPVSGRILYDSADLTHIPPGDRPISILFQDNNLFPHLTIAQNAGLGVRPVLRLKSDELARVAEVLEQVGLAGFDARLPGDLSGGQQSRAALARVLLAERPVVLLDEPFAALGPGLKHEMLDLVKRTLLTPDRTIVMVTHDPDDAKRAAQHVVLVAEHTANKPEPTSSIFASPPAVLARYLGTGMD